MRIVNLIFAISLMMFHPYKASAQQTSKNVVFEVTSGSQEEWESALGNVENLLDAMGKNSIRVEVVGHSDGLEMMMEDSLKDRMKKLTDYKITFAACENTMQKKNVSRKELLPFVTTVDSGVAEVVRRQQAGWSYLKGDA